MQSVNQLIFSLITFAWLLEFLVFRPRTQAYTYKEPLGFDWIAAVIIFTIILSRVLYNVDLFLIQGIIGSITQYVGLVLYAFGTTLRFVGSVTLGPLYTRFIQIEPHQPLISHGIYQYLRHPMYLGLFLLISAIPMVFQNWLITPMTILFMGVVIRHRMNFEERKMEQIIGERYVTWKTKRLRLFP
jgi:protein-S-isoprenylcysteine O-methyltransferase Ste14